MQGSWYKLDEPQTNDGWLSLEQLNSGCDACGALLTFHLASSVLSALLYKSTYFVFWETVQIQYNGWFLSLI